MDESKLVNQLLLKIPSFLIKDVSANRNDTKKLIFHLQRLLFWQAIFPNQPYDDVRARKLQYDFGVALAHHNRLVAQQRVEERQRVDAEYATLCQKIVEFCFAVEVVASDEGVVAGQVAWTTDIRDKVTGVKLGSPRQLLNGECAGAITMGWTAVNADARTNLIGYLTEIRRKYDGWSYRFGRFDREELKPPKFLRDKAGVVLDVIRGVSSKSPRYFDFTLHLNWKPFSEHEVAEQLEKLVVQHES